MALKQPNSKMSGLGSGTDSDEHGNIPKAMDFQMWVSQMWLCELKLGVSCLGS